jgi:uncharacterized protein YjbI with pentapeptide repeats
MAKTTVEKTRRPRAQCTVRMSGQVKPWEDGNPCRRDAVVVKDDEGRCYFHANATDVKKDPAEFVRLLLDEVINPQTADPKRAWIDCTCFVFPSISFPEGFEFMKNANFRLATFTGVAFFPLVFAGDARFDGAAFIGDAKFPETTFAGRALFRSATFAGGALFRLATFTKEANFTEAIFSDALFTNAKVLGDLHFGSATLAGPVRLNKVSFEGRLDLSAATVKGLLDFEDSRFRNPVTWRDTVFYPTAEVLMRRTSIESLFIVEEVGFPTPDEALKRDASLQREWEAPTKTEWSHHKAQWVVRARRDWDPADAKRIAETNNGARFYPLSTPGHGYPVGDPDVRIAFTNVLIGSSANVLFIATRGDVSSRLDMSKFRLAHTDVARIRFVNVKWGQPEPRDRTKLRQLRFEAWLLGKTPHEFAIVTDEAFDRKKEPAGDLDASQVVAIYKGLRESYEQCGHYSEAGVFHVREMEMRTLAGDGGPFLWFYKWVSRYGESYRLAGIWLALTWLLFAVGFHTVGSMNDYLSGVVVSRGYRWDEALLASFAAVVPSFSSAGSGWLPAVERVLGVVFVAFFGLALNRNFRR